MGAESNNPLKIFSCYASDDQHWYQQLDGHLSILQQQKLIRIADESKILAGSAQREERLKLFNNADIILLLISPDFLKSRYQDMEDALALQKTGKVHVIPILVRPVMSTGAPFHSLRCLPTNKVPIARWTDPDEAFENVAEELLLVVNELRESCQKISSLPDKDPPQDDPELLALVTDQSGFMDDRLESFVGREKELADIHNKIAELTAKGGYITITGQAGQGKSSMIAKLVQHADPQKVAHHFIPLNPGPDYQVVLLRNLMTRLILKYRLSSLYVSSESRPALRDFFPKVLKEIAASGEQEVIFIDGLDQLEEDATGIRDLSFLPTRLPPGIVFVLGTRPNDTLRPLELLNPHSEYQLPNMSRTDFDLILARRGVMLKSSIADRFYDAMEQNALYLDLVAKELREVEIPQPEEIIQRLSSNPQHLFALAIERLQRQPVLWEKVLYPMLGILLAARESLHRQHLAQLLGVRDHQCREGLTKLGGLVIVDGQQKCSLFHLKFRDFLREDEQAPDKEYLFSLQEETSWHKVMAEWCEGKDINCIWEEIASNWLEQERRKYAQQHYITHLYYAGEHKKLFDVLDQGEFGQGKLKIDPNTRSYIQDLDLGRLAAGSDEVSFEVQLERLPRLWRYTLLRCSLASRVDQYPISAFKLLILLGRQQEALGLADLVTKPEQKAEVLLEIASQIIVKPGSKTEALKIVLRAEEVAETIKISEIRDNLLCKAGCIFTQLQKWEKAGNALKSIKDVFKQSKGLQDLSKTLIKEQNWDMAKRVIDCIWISEQREEALDDLAKALAKAHLWKRAHTVIDSIWEISQKVKALVNLGLELVQAGQKEQAKKVCVEVRQTVQFIVKREQQTNALCDTVRAFVQVLAWDWADITAYSIQNRLRLWQALQELGATLAQIQDQEEANIIWREANTIWADTNMMINSIYNGKQQVKALCELGKTLAQAQRWDEADAIWIDIRQIINSIRDSWEQAQALRNLAIALAQSQNTIAARMIIDSFQSNQQYVWALQDLGGTLAQARQWQEAREVINSIQDKWKKAEALQKLGRALAQAQLWQEAREVINSIQYGGEHTRALSDLGMALAQAQRWDEARTVIDLIQHSKGHIDCLYVLGTSLAQAQRWDEARTVIDLIQHSKGHIDRLYVLGISLAQAQRWDEANAIWMEAHEVLNSMQDREQQVPVLRELGRALAQAQRWDEAREVINAIQNRAQQIEALRELGTALAQAQRWDEAREVINAIQNRAQQIEALRELGTALAQAQRWDEARQVVNSIHQEEHQARALQELGKALAQAQRWDEAHEVINAIQNRVQQIEASRELATALAQAQRWDEARQVVNSIHQEEHQALALRELGKALAQAQQWEEARQMVNSIHQKEYQAGGQRELATALAQAQQWMMAREVINSIQDRWQKEKALRELGKALAQAQQWEETRQITNSIQDSEHRVEASRELATALAQAQRWDEARQIINSIQDRWQKEWALQELGKALAQSQQWVEARHVINSIQDSEQRTRALRELATALAQAQQWAETRQIINSIRDSEQQARALRELATALAQAQQWAETRQVISSIQDSEQRTRALRELAMALAQAQRWAEARKIINSIRDSEQQARALRELATALAQAQRWTEARKVINSIQDSEQRSKTLKDLCNSLSSGNKYKQLLHLTQREWLNTETREDAISLFSLVTSLVVYQPSLCIPFAKSFTWVDQFLSGGSSDV